MTRLRRALALATPASIAAPALLLGGCFEAPPPKPAVWQGERVVVHTDLVEEVCVGTVDLLDRSVVQIERELELPARSELIHVWIVDDIDCGGAWACARAGKAFIHGDMYPFAARHELVHARLDLERGTIKPFFEEALATVIGGTYLTPCTEEALCRDKPLDELLAASESRELGTYDSGGDLLRHLLVREGPAAVLQFTDAITRSMPADEVRARYAEAFGGSLDEDFLAAKRGPLDAFTPTELGCGIGVPVTPDEAGVYRFVASLDCSSPLVANDFVAALDGEFDRGVVEWSFVVPPAATGTFVVTGELPPDTALRLRRCAWDTMWHQEAGPYNFGWDGPPPITPGLELVLGPGPHTLTWSGPLDPALTVDLRLTPDCSFEAQDCPAGQQCTIWNRCEPQVAEPAALGESCEQGPGDARACEAGSRCVGGLCIAECDATQPCPDGQACARERVCGSSCELLAQACGDGWSCTPSADLRAARDGWGACVPAGTVKVRQPCDREGLECEAGLTCQTANALGETRCAPYCADSTDCTGQLYFCDPLLDGVAGYCRGS